MWDDLLPDNEKVKVFDKGVNVVNHKKFEYYDNGYHKVPDVKGLSVKKTHWTSEKIMWHRAYTNCMRVTIAVCSKEERDIDNFIRNLSYK